MLIFVLGDGSHYYTPTVPDPGNNNNRELNPLGSQYAATFGHSNSALIQRIVRKQIYETSPKQYADLTLLSLKKSELRLSDEFSYHEMGWGREAIVNSAIGSSIAAGTTQVIPIQNPDAVHLDMIVTYPDNTKATVIAKTSTTITVRALSWETLPLIPISSAGTFVLSNHSPLEADGQNDIKKYSRFTTIERTNYIQFLVEAQRYGRVEMLKYQNAGTFDNWLTLQKKNMYTQHRVSLSNCLWNGTQGEATLSNGEKAKTTGGLYPMMLQAGSSNSSVTLVNAPAALEELALDTEFGEFGETRFLYAAPKAIHYLSKQYKSSLTRYTPNDMVAKLELSSIDMGSSRIVFVPVRLFQEQSCFPTHFRNKMFLVDQNSLQPVHMIPEEMGSTLDRRNNGTLQNYVDDWISSSIGFEYRNPLGGGWISITDLP